MTNPNEYPQIPPGVAPIPASIGGEFAAIRRGVEEAARRPPPVIPPSSPPETVGTGGSLYNPWTNLGYGYQPFGYHTIGTRVFLRGTVTPSAAVAVGGFVAFVPRTPTGIEPFEVSISGGAGRVDVRADGVVLTQTALGAGAFLSLSGITYSTL